MVAYRYLPNGELDEMRDGLDVDSDQYTKYEYDELNRIKIKTEYGIRKADESKHNLKTQYFYDEDSNLIREINPRLIERKHTYDHLNRLTETKIISGPSPEAVGRGNVVMNYDYDLVNNKLSETDHHGHKIEYKYDGLYRVVETHLPHTHAFTGVPFMSAIIKTGYDRMGNKVFETDANGQKTMYQYDKIYRLMEKIDADGNKITYRYDRANNKIREENHSSGLITQWETQGKRYDGLNRPAIMEQTVPLGVPGLTDVLYTTLYNYEDSDNAVIITNPRGFKMRTDKDGLDRVFQTIVDEGRLNLTTTYTYDGNGNVKTIKDPEGGDIDVTHVYDGLNRKIKSKYVSTPSDNTPDLPVYEGGSITEEFTYDGNNNLVEYKDKRGIVFTNTYDNLNRPLKKKVIEHISNGSNELTLMEYQYSDVADENELYTVTEVDANRNTTVTSYDGLHRPTKIDDPDPDPVGLIEYTYDGVNKREESDKKGYKTAYSYDTINRLVDTKEFDLSSALRTTLHVDYMDESNRVEEIDRRGIRTIRQLDALGRLVQHKRSGLDMATHYGNDMVLLETYEYDGNNNTTTFIDGRGNRTKYTYDGADRKETMTEGFGTSDASTTTYRYDNVNNILSIKDGRNHGGAFDKKNTYDARYRKISETNGEWETTTYSYDGNDNLVSMTEPEGQSFKTVYLYDELNKLLAIIETPRADANTKAGVTRFFYDGYRNKIAQQDANGNLVTYTYDALNRPTDTFQHTVPGGDTGSALHWHYGYDLNSNQNLIIDAKDQRVDMVHDYLDRLETKAYSNHTEPGLDFQMQSVVYTYDGNSNVESITETKQINGSGKTEITSQKFDPLDRPQTVTHIDYDGTQKAIEYDYDIQGNRTAVKDPDNINTIYTFDNRNRLKTVITEAGTTRYTWWEDSLLKKVAYPNRTVCDRSDPGDYDAADRLLHTVNHRPNPDPHLPPAIYSEYTYTYDDNGNRLSQIETQQDLNGGNPETTTYSYDKLNRLHSVTYGAGTNAATLTYTYEKNGNRLTETGTDPHTGQPVNRLYKYEELPGKTGVTFDHVNALTQIVDNLDPGRTVTYEYDLNLNQTARVKDGNRTQYHYGIQDQILRVTAGQDDSVARYDYDHERMRIKKLAGESGMETRYLYDQNSVLVEYDGAGPDHPTSHKYDYGYELLSLTKFDTISMTRDSQFYMKDGLMSTANLTDEAGGLLHSYCYDAWGRIRDQYGTADNPRQYTGHYKDYETGLHYFGARYYDDETGRFLTQDPYLGDENTPPSLHRYLYAYANPLRYVDLTGYESVPMFTDEDIAKYDEYAKAKSSNSNELIVSDDVKPELRNTVIDPETGDYHEARSSDRWVIVERAKELEKAEKRVEEMIGPLEAHIKEAEEYLKNEYRFGCIAGEIRGCQISLAPMTEESIREWELRGGQIPWYEKFNALFYGDVIERYKDYIENSAYRHNIDPDLIRSVMVIESVYGGFKETLGELSEIIGGKPGGKRPMNVRSSWAERLGWTAEDLENPEIHIDIAAEMLANIQKSLGERATPGEVYSIYHYTGQTSVSRRGMQVQSLYERKPWKDWIDVPTKDTSYIFFPGEMIGEQSGKFALRPGPKY